MQQCEHLLPFLHIGCRSFTPSEVTTPSEACVGNEEWNPKSATSLKDPPEQLGDHETT
jgi:hypothetical protein